MKTILFTLFPLFYWLTAFEKLGYRSAAFMAWIHINWHTRDTEEYALPQPTPRAIITFSFSVIGITSTYFLLTALIATLPLPCSYKIIVSVVVLLFRLQVSFLDLWLARIAQVPIDSVCGLIRRLRPR